ncbi:hypothetical protein SAMN05444000_1521, partial [Shimia gijangensis]
MSHSREWLLPVWLYSSFAPAANDRIPPILWKNNVLLAQKVVSVSERKRLSFQALPVCC